MSNGRKADDKEQRAQGIKYSLKRSFRKLAIVDYMDYRKL
jgi:hypothetical protein